MTRSSLPPIFALLFAAIAAAGMFTAQTGFAAEQAAKVPTGREASVKQFSQELAANFMKTHMGPGALVDPLSPVQQQRMQESLDAYFHSVVAGLLGGGNGEADKGFCMTGKIAQCRPGDVEVPGSADLCEGKGKATCSKGAVKRCQDAKTLKGYTVTTSCKWNSLP